MEDLERILDIELRSCGSLQEAATPLLQARLRIYGVLAALYSEMAIYGRISTPYRPAVQSSEQRAAAIIAISMALPRFQFHGLIHVTGRLKSRTGQRSWWRSASH
jgi:hypothetical protein